MRRRPYMDLITLDMAYGVHIFVKDRAKSKDPAVKRPVQFTENDESFFEGVFMPKKFHQFRVFTVFRMLYFDKADDFEFLGSKESVRKQIGMAVPCRGAKIIFEALLKCFAGIEYESVEASINE